MAVSKLSLSPECLTILDANLNRVREGLRVCEEVCRFVWKSPKLTQDIRLLRHGIKKNVMGLPYAQILKARSVSNDVGKKPHVFERTRRGWPDVFLANLQRSKEALRVIEEIMKLESISMSNNFKAKRFALYEFENKCLKKL